MDVPTQDEASLRTGSGSELPRDAEVFALGLEDDSYLHGAKIAAGALSVVALVAMLITSLFRAPNGAWTVAVAAVAAGLIVVMSAQMFRRRRHRRRSTEP